MENNPTINKITRYIVDIDCNEIMLAIFQFITEQAKFYSLSVWYIEEEQVSELENNDSCVKCRFVGGKNLSLYEIYQDLSKLKKYSRKTLLIVLSLLKSSDFLYVNVLFHNLTVTRTT